MVPAIPFLAFPVIFYLQQAGRSFWIWAVFVVAALWSIFVVWAEFLGGELFPKSGGRDPLVQYSLPALSHNETSPNLGMFFGLRGWETLLPLILVILIIIGWRGRQSKVSGLGT